MDVIKLPGLSQDKVFACSHSHFLGFGCICVHWSLLSSAWNKQYTSVPVCLLPHRLYHITLWTFLLALGHFLSELFVYGTAAPTIGVLAPLMVASKHATTLDFAWKLSQPWQTYKGYKMVLCCVSH